jgi:hypothetical protein
MPEFDQRIQQIQRSVDELTSSLRDVESAVGQASKEFEAMSRNAESINQVASSVSKLERLVDRLEKSPFTERLREQVSQMNAELQKMDTSRLETVTSAIQAQTQAQKNLNQVQINLNNNFRRTKEIVDTMVASLGTLSQAAESLSTKAATSIGNIGTSLQSISTHEQQVQTVISALNSLDPSKYDQSAQALRAVADAAERISKANINVSQVKQTQRVAAAGPTEAARKYAEEHNIDLSAYEGRVTVRQLRSAQQASAPVQQQEVAGLQSEVQKRLESYNRLYQRAQQYDKVLSDITSAQSRALEAALKNREIDDPKIQQQFREAILSGDKAKQYDLGKEYRGKFLDVRQVYEQNLGKESISSEIDKFKDISITDEAMIKEIARCRKILSERGQVIKKELEQANQPTENLPNFSLRESLGKPLNAAKGISENAYRPFSYGVSQAGALLNSVTQILQGLSRGGPGGILDALGGAFKGIHTIANANAYYGLNLLPKGIGETFSPKRSGTLVDIAEAYFGVTKGYGRNPISRNLASMESRESPLVNRVGSIRNAMDMVTDPTELVKLNQALLDSTKELQELRKNINAYRKVLAQEAQIEAEEAAKKGGPSTGAALGEGITPNSRLYNVDYERTFSDVKQQLSSREGLLSNQAEQALRKFGAGTGFDKGIGAGVILVDQNKVGSLVNQFYKNANIPKGTGVSGFNIPVYQDENRSIASSFSAATLGSKNQAQTLAHEIVHELVEQTRRTPSGGLSSTGLYNNEGLTDSYIAKLSRYRKTQLDFSDVRGALSEYSERGHDYEGMLKSASKNVAYKDYLFRPSEQLAHVGESLISNNTQMQDALKTLYGPHLFDGIKKQLAQQIPEVFADEPLRILQSRYSQMSSELDSIISNSATTPVKNNIASLLQDILKAFTDSLGPLGDQISAIIQQILGGTGVTSPLSAKLSPGQGQGFNLESLIGFLPSNPRRLAETALQNPTGSSLINAIGSGQNIGAAVKGLDIKGILTQYAIRVFKEDTEVPLGLIGTAIKNSRLTDRVFESIANQVEKTVTGQQQPNNGPLAGLRNRGIQELLRIGLETQLPATTSFRDELNDFVRSKTGKNIQAGSFQQTATFNPTTGMTEFALSAKTADGAMVNLNGHLDEFGRKKIIDPSKQMGEMTRLIKEFFTAIPRQLGYQLTYSMTDAVQRSFQQILSIQDELSEISTIGGAGARGPKASALKYDFLHRSVQTAQFTGQGFDEAVQTNLKNYKILGAIPNQNQRADLSNQLSKVQLGAQTAFGISLEQSLESIPAILTSISDGLDGVDDPVKRTTISIQQLQEVMDKMVLAQRATGASGDELITVYSRLAAGAKEYGLSSQDLLALTATSSVSIGKGADETSNVLRALLEGTYSDENQGALRKFGITTKQFNSDTGNIQNRNFTDVMGDLVKFIQSPETKDQSAQLYQVFGGPRNAQDIGKIIRGYAAGNQRVNESINQGYTGENFDQLVQTKSQNLEGSLKKLGAAGTELFNTFLVGTGAMDGASKFFDRLADSAGRLTDFFSQHGKEIKNVFDFISNYLKYNLIGQLSKDVNIFSPVAKGMGAIKTTVSSTISTLVDFGYEGEASSNKLLKSFQILGKVFNEIEASAFGTSKAMASAANSTAATAATLQPRLQPGVAIAEEEAMFSASAQPRQLNRFGRGMQFLGNTFNRLSTANPTFGGLSSWWSNNRNPLRNAAMTVGDNAGSMLAPAGFDLVTGGLNKSNVINTAGAALAGTFLGSVTASPQLGLVGYGMAKSFLDNIDFSKFFGASEKEMGSFASALAEAIRKANLTPEQKAKEDKNDQLTQEQESQLAITARENFGKLDQMLGLGKFDQSYAGFVNNQSRANRAILNLPGQGISSEEIARYRRLVVNGEQPQDFQDKRFLSSKNDIFGANRYNAVGSLYQLLGSDQLRTLYEKSNVTDPTKFLQMFSELQQGRGELLQNKDIRDILGQIEKGSVQAKTDNIDSAGNHVTASLETSNDIIKRINENLTEFNTEASKLKEMPYGLTQYAAFGTKQTELDKKFAPQLEDIRSGKIKGQDAQRILDQYDKSKSSYESIPQSLQSLMPLAQSLGLNTKGLEQHLYNLGSEGQGQLAQRFGQAQQSDQFVKDYESRQKALKQYESTDLYKAKDASILKEHDALQKALATDKARYLINKQYLDLIKSQSNILLDQAATLEKQNQTRQLISAGTPAQFNPLSLFDTQGYSASQINKAIEAALEKQRQLEKLSPGYKKYFGEQQFLLQGQGGFKPVTGIDQNFMQQALQSQQIKPPSLEDLSQFSDVELQKVLGRARSLQNQAVALNPDLAGKYDDERLLIFRKNNQLLQEVGLSQEYLKLAIQENTKSNDTLRGHYNLPSSYRAPTVWDYYSSGGKETGDVNFPNKTGQGAMVPLSFAQQLAQEFLNASKSAKGGVDLSEITTTAGPGSTGKPRFYSGGSAPVYSEPLPQVLPDTVKLPQAPQPSVRQEIENFKHELAVQAREQSKARQKDLHSYDDIETKRLGKQESKGPLDAIKDALDKTRTTLGLTDDKLKDLGVGAAIVGSTLTGFTSSAATLALNTNAFSSAITSLLAKVQTFDLARAMKAANIQINVTVGGETQKASQVTINNTSGGGTGALTAQPTARTRIS